MMSRIACSVVALLMASLLGGCQAYTVPGSGANLAAISGNPSLAQDRAQQTDPSVDEMLNRKPLASFPATVAIVRVQGADYTGRTVDVYGSGAFRVVTSHDVEKPDQLQQLGHLPMLAALEPINRLELPTTLSGADDLRKAAALVHADMLLLYTFDDRFDDRDLAEGLTLLTLGISPTKDLTISSTASAVLVDTRNGYIYGAAEAADKKSTLANCWGEDAAADAVREQVETAAFAKLVTNLSGMWGNVVKQYAISTPAASTPAGAAAATPSR